MWGGRGGSDLRGSFGGRAAGLPGQWGMRREQTGQVLGPPASGPCVSVAPHSVRLTHTHTHTHTHNFCGSDIATKIVTCVQNTKFSFVLFLILILTASPFPIFQNTLNEQFYLFEDAKK